MSTPSPAASSTLLRQSLTTVPAMLDALVRNTRGGAPPRALAERLLKMWREHDAAPLSLHPDGVQLRDEPTHALDSGWCYYAFMAGLRSVRLTETTDLADILRLANALADVRFNVDAAERLRAWTWEEDGEAFGFTVTRSFAETMEASDVAPEIAATSVTALRGASLAPMDGLRIRQRQLDEAATRPEFDVELPLYRDASRRRAHEVDGDLLRTLQRKATDAASWASLELSVLCEDGMPGTLAPARLARRLEASLGSERPETAFQYLVALERSRPGIVDDILELLDEDRLLTVLTSVKPHRRMAAPLAEGLRARGAFAVRLLNALVGHAPSSDDASTLIDTILRDEELRAQLLDFIDLTTVEAPAVTWVLGRVPQAQLAEALEQLDPDVATAVLLDMRHGTLLSEHHGAVDRVLQTGSFQARNSLASHLATSTARHEERLLARSVLDAAAEPWGPRAAFLVCNRVRDAGLTRDVLLPLARNRNTTANLRVAALHVLENDPGALAEAARWSVSELFAPPDVRSALKKARRRGDP
ncbi:MAG: hypothetical protein AAGA54_02890 [Myxococcota bacterium]